MNSGQKEVFRANSARRIFARISNGGRRCKTIEKDDSVVFTGRQMRQDSDEGKN
jgi:hypothetical protein